jgi:hypothetical protein
MNIVIPPYGHVPDRMRERGISREDIESVLTNHTSSWTNMKGKSRVYQGSTRDGRVIHVVIVEPPPDSETFIVKTTYDPTLEEST